MISRFAVPAARPARKILAVDIGGTLAKAAFYLPRNDPARENFAKFESLTGDTIPSKLSLALGLCYDLNSLGLSRA